MANQPATGVVDIIVRRVRTLLGKQNKDRDFICRHLEIGNDEMAAKFDSFGFKFNDRAVVLGNVPANTTDLSAFQAPGQPLFDLLTPSKLEWKLTGQPEEMWDEVDYVEGVVDTNLGSGLAGAAVQSDRAWVESWEWRGGVIFTSPCSEPVDFRARGEFMPTLVSNDATDPLRGAINILAFNTAWSIAMTEGGPASALGKVMQARMTNALGDFQSNQSKGQQTRITQLGGRRDVRGSGGFPPPIG